MIRLTSPIMKYLLLFFVILPWLALFLIPVLSLFLSGETRVDGSFGWREFFDPLLLSKVQFTVFQAGVSALISGVIGLPLGLFLRRSPRAAGWLRLPFGVPSLVAAVAWVSLLSSSSIQYSFSSVLLAHVVFNIPWVAFAVAEAGASIPQGWDDLARSLGARGWARWRFVLMPVITPSWLAACVQVFVFCSMSFALVLILGGGPPVETLETGIYSSVRTGALDLMVSARLATWQLVICLVPWLLVRLFWRPLVVSGPSLKSLRREPWTHHLLGLVWITPYFAFFKNQDWLVALSPSFWSAIRSPLVLSLMISAAVASLSVLWSLLAITSLRSIGNARIQRWIEVLLLLPSGVSTLTLSLGFWLAYAHWIDPFEGSLLAMVLIQALVFFPLVFRILWPLAQNLPRDLLSLARSLGASAMRAWREVEWPRWRPSVFQCWSLVMAASLGELSAVSFFSSEKIVTLPLLVSRWMAQYRFDDANGVAVVLLVLSAILSFGARVERSR